jgi:hypothetical protein
MDAPFPSACQTGLRHTDLKPHVHLLRRNTMRNISLVAGVVLVTAIVALLSTHAITVSGLHADVQLPAIDVMQMMRDAKDLPVQQFDAI